MMPFATAFADLSDAFVAHALPSAVYPRRGPFATARPRSTMSGRFAVMPFTAIAALDIECPRGPPRIASRVDTRSGSVRASGLTCPNVLSMSITFAPPRPCAVHVLKISMTMGSASARHASEEMWCRAHSPAMSSASRTVRVVSVTSSPV